jgi:hypothetical protein
MTYLKHLLKGFSAKAFPDPSYTKTLDKKWLASIRRRFADREDIGRERVYESYFEKEGLPKASVFECFDLIDTEYGRISGLVRPDDSLDKLFEPVATKNPFRWMTYETMAGDRQLWFSQDLKKQMKKHGTLLLDLRVLKTIGDFVRAWCGKLPHGHAAEITKTE